jgi:membrane dipeptidase
MKIKIIDGHNDTLSRILRAGDISTEYFFGDWQNHHIDFSRLMRSDVKVLICAVFIPNPSEPSSKLLKKDETQSTPLALAIDKAYAQKQTERMLDIYSELIDRSSGKIVAITDQETLVRVLTGEQRGSILMFEGADMIEPDLSNLRQYYDAGLRVLSPTWSRTNCFATGVPLDYPGHPDQGPGLTPEGLALVKKCQSMGILIDVSHLNEKGFWNVIEISEKPIIASHSGVYAECQSPRNLTDEQLKAIAKIGGVLGVTFSTSEIRADGKTDSNTPVGAISKHILHAIEVMGSEHVAFGSDFEGTVIPNTINDICGYNVLIDDLVASGVNNEVIERIAYKNWQRVLELVL